MSHTRAGMDAKRARQIAEEQLRILEEVYDIVCHDIGGASYLPDEGRWAVPYILSTCDKDFPGCALYIRPDGGVELCQYTKRVLDDMDPLAPAAGHEKNDL